MDMREEEENSIENISFDDKINSYLKNDLYLFSKESKLNGNEYFESEFKKVFKFKDTFEEIWKEEEKDAEKEKEDKFRINKKQIFKLIYNANKNVHKINNLKKKNIFTILGKNSFKNYSFDQIILYIKKLNNSTKNSSSISYKHKLLKIEHKLIMELKNRLLNKIKENDNI